MARTQVGWLGIVLVACMACACGSEAPRAESASQVPVGLLARPLGSWLKIEGVREEHGKAGTRTLRVDRVDEREVSPAVSIWVDNLDLPAGERVKLSGYESGRWIGLPPEVERAEHLQPHQAAWQFQKFFVVTSVQAPAALAERFPAPPRAER